MKKILFASMMLVALVAATFTSCSKDDSDPAMVGTWVYTDTQTNSWGSTTNTFSQTLTLTLNEDGTGTLNELKSSRTNPTSTSDYSINMVYTLIYTYDPEKNDRHGELRLTIVSSSDEKETNASYAKGYYNDFDFSVAGDKLSLNGRVYNKR